MNKFNEHNLGIAYVLISTFCFVANDAVMKSLLEQMPWYQTMAFRGIFATFFCFALAIILDGKKSVKELSEYFTYKPSRWRIIFELLATIFYLIALAQIALADAVAIAQFLPIFLTIGAVISFKEKLNFLRIIATFIGFIGVMLIIKPGTSAFTPFALFALAGTLSMALRDLVTRNIKTTLSSSYLAAMSMLAIWFLGIVFSIGSNLPPLNWFIIAQLILSGLLISLAFFFTILLMRISEISFLAPFRYTGLLWGVLLGFVFFGDLPDYLTIFGSILVIIAGLLVLQKKPT